MSTDNADKASDEPQERGFEYRGVFYKMPGVGDFRPCDPALFNAATGLRWSDFLEQMQEYMDNEDEDAEPDFDMTVAVGGFIAVAVWQHNKLWTRDKALRFFQHMTQSEIDMIEPDIADEEIEDDSAQKEEEVPLPANGDGPAPSSSSQSPSKPEPVSASKTTTPSDSGTPRSATGVT